MNQIILKIFLSISFLITLSCGFKVLDKSKENNFMIKEIQTTGSNRINFKIKNNLLINSKNNSDNIILINLDTEKIKGIREKNIKNEITKYQILLISKVKIQIFKDSKNINFNRSAVGEFLVGDNYSTTVTNEKKLIDNLVDHLSEKILDKINSEIHDN